MPMTGGKCHNITFSKGYNIFGALNFTGNQTYLNSFKLKSSFFFKWDYNRETDRKYS